MDQINERLHNIDLKDYIPKENILLSYKGPVDFCCDSRLVNELYKRFGIPACNSKQDNQKSIIYSVQEAEITVELLSWLAKSRIRIEGPVILRDRIRDYQDNLNKLLAKK